ncbi:hypothetical protein NG895_01960 [Aeoliella sp. ICT_H6.2]|uniref:Uncharacterized protein n=1 Tax=Aeoliella straminimaris TaxID=2954799 RepID=A0A9X2FEL8_9BACT|nr:hypothetical protein [Aeoliella straminimaris]MCO6042661.1 hypothetical protein [Aeoliella straminimaris]
MLLSSTTPDVFIAGLEALLMAICLPGIVFGAPMLIAACWPRANARLRRYVLHGTWTCAAVSLLFSLLAVAGGEGFELENVFFTLLLFGAAGAFWGGVIALVIEAPAEKKRLYFVLLGILAVVLLGLWIWLTQVFLAFQDWGR